MLFYSNVKDGGARVWINRKQKYTDRLEQEKVRREQLQREAGQFVDADRAWIVAKPDQIQ
jgi:hypothetical protein